MATDWSHRFHRIFGVVTLSVLTACSSAPAKKDGAAESATAQENQALKNEVVSLQSRINELEKKLASVTTRLQAAQTSVDNVLHVRKPLTDSVISTPIEQIGHPVEPSIAASDPQAGFVNDSAVNEYRQALVTFNAGQYADAALGFAKFLQAHPDHPLAGSAQYYIGECYFMQKDYELAHRELGRVINAYDRSIHVSEALRRIAEVEEILKKPEESARHRQLLTALFPQSPAAGKAEAVAVVAPKAAEIPADSTPGLDQPPATAPVPTAPIPSNDSTNDLKNDPADLPAESL